MGINWIKGQCIEHIYRRCALALVISTSVGLTGCATNGSGLSIASSAVQAIKGPDLLLVGAAALVYFELNSKSGWQAKVQQVDANTFEVSFGRSFLSFEASQPVSGAAREVLHTVCGKTGGRWLRLEEGVQAQQLGVRTYAAGQLECHEVPLDLQQRKMQGMESGGAALPPLPLGAQENGHNVGP